MTRRGGVQLISGADPMRGESRTLLLCGASTRAAALAALAAGLRPVCIDLFADRDLRAACPVKRLAGGRYPRGFVELAHQAPPGPWAYVGGLENHPDVVDALTQERALWGNPGEVLRRVRDPWLVQEALRAAGLHAPALAASPSAVPRDGSWLVKPLRGSGGRGIRPWRGQQPRADLATLYFQERKGGEPVSFVFVANPDGDVQVLGSSRQLVGETWLHAGPFAYSGSLAPYSPGAGSQADFVRQCGRIAHVLAKAFALRGICGVDCVWCEGKLWVIEVNPRLVASAEVVGAVAGVNPLAAHAQVFEPRLNLETQITPQVPARGKAVYYAPRDLRFPARFEPPTAEGVTFADVPVGGSAVRRGAPVLTMLADGADAEACLRTLKKQAGMLDARWSR